jgi:hypothetical protein
MKIFIRQFEQLHFVGAFGTPMRGGHHHRHQDSKSNSFQTRLHKAVICLNSSSVLFRRPCHLAMRRRSVDARKAAFRQDEGIGRLKSSSSPRPSPSRRG